MSAYGARLQLQPSLSGIVATATIRVQGACIQGTLAVQYSGESITAYLIERGVQRSLGVVRVQAVCMVVQFA